MAHRAIEGYDSLPTLYANYVASSITDMNGTGYTPSQVWMDYSGSSLTDSDGNNAANSNIYLAGTSEKKIGVAHWPDTLYKGNGTSITKQGTYSTIKYWDTASGGTYQRTKQHQMGYYTASSTTVRPRGESVSAIEYDDVLYQEGNSVTTVGKQVVYTPSSANPRFYNASKVTRVSLKKAALTTATATVLKI